MPVELPEIRSSLRNLQDKVQHHKVRLDRLDRKISPIKAGQIQGVHIDDGAIAADHLQADSVRATTISAGAISAGHIAAWTINAGHIQALAIKTDHLAAGSVTATQILAGSINADHITAGAIEAGHISAGTINAAHIQAASIKAGHIEADAISAEHIAADSIDAEQIRADAITSNHIQANSITGDHLAVQVTLSGMIRTSSGTGSRVEIDNDGLRGYDGSNNEKFRFDTATGTLELDGIITAEMGSAVPVTYVTSGNIVSGTVITIDSGGYLQTDPDPNNQVRLDSAGLRAYSGGALKASIQAATSSFTGGTFQTSEPGSNNRVVMDSAGLRAYGSGAEAVVEKVNISGGTATITGGTLRTAASPAARVVLDGPNNRLSIFDATQERLRLDSTWGLALLAGGSLDITDNALATWRNNPLASAGVTAALGGIRYTDGGGAWNWALVGSQYGGSENAGAVLRAGSLSQPKADVICWNQPTAGFNRRRVELAVRNDADSATYSIVLQGSSGETSFPGRVRFDTVRSVSGSLTLDSSASVYLNLNSGGSSIRHGNGAGTYTAEVLPNGSRWGTDPGGGAYRTYSGVELKKNISDHVDKGKMRAKLRNLKIRQFQYREDNNLVADGVVSGLIAQEVEQNFPWLISTIQAPGDPNDESRPMTKGLDYSLLTIPLIDSVQDLDNEVEELKARIAALEKRK